jgi:hypothetical protein
MTEKHPGSTHDDYCVTCGHSIYFHWNFAFGCFIDEIVKEQEKCTCEIYTEERFKLSDEEFRYEGKRKIKYAINLLDYLVDWKRNREV